MVPAQPPCHLSAGGPWIPPAAPPGTRDRPAAIQQGKEKVLPPSFSRTVVLTLTTFCGFVLPPALSPFSFQLPLEGFVGVSVLIKKPHDLLTSSSGAAGLSAFPGNTVGFPTNKS